jgi:hypothetical protein
LISTLRVVVVVALGAGAKAAADATRVENRVTSFMIAV